MTAGLTNQGYVAETEDEYVADLTAGILANVDAGLDLSPDQPFGQIVGIFAAKLAALDAVVETAYNAINPNAAEGALLANAAALSGTLPQVATYSTVTAQLTLASTTTCPAGSVFAVINQPANTWVLLADVTSTTSGPYSGLCRASNPGAFAAPENSLTVINTPVVGLTAVNNPAAATVGLNADTDTTLRQKRIIELAGEGSGTLDALVAAVTKVDEGILSVFGYENTSLVTDANGLPGKAFRIVIWDGVSPSATNADVAQAIWQNKASGIQAFGATSATVTDSQGNPHTVAFDRATQKPVYVNCTTTPSTLTTDQTAAVKQSIQAFIANLGLGTSIIARKFSASPLEPVSALDATPSNPEYLPFITDVVTFAFDFVSTAATNTGNLTISGLQIATLTSLSQILVNGV